MDEYFLLLFHLILTLSSIFFEHCEKSVQRHESQLQVVIYFFFFFIVQLIADGLETCEIYPGDFPPQNKLNS